MGHLKNRKEILGLLQTLPLAKTLEDGEILKFIETRQLYGTGIGWIDAHLLASALLSRALLWTSDTKLHKAAIRLDIQYKSLC